MSYTVTRYPGTFRTWQVVDELGRCWFAGTQAECWRWIDDQDPKSNRDEEAYRRIQQAFAER